MSLKDKFWKIPALVSVLVALSYFGLDASGLRPAWFFEHEALANEFYQDKCERLKKEWYLAMESKGRYALQNQPMPKWLIDQIVQLEADMKEAGC